MRNKGGSSQASHKAKILSQIEYYFGDENYPKDKHIQKLASECIKPGWVPISEIMSFNRMRSICKDTDTVIESLKGSKILEVDSIQKFVRRTLSSRESPAVVQDHDPVNNAMFQETHYRLMSFHTYHFTRQVSYKEQLEYYYGTPQCINPLLNNDTQDVQVGDMGVVDTDKQDNFQSPKVDQVSNCSQGPQKNIFENRADPKKDYEIALLENEVKNIFKERVDRTPKRCKDEFKFWPVIPIR